MLSCLISNNHDIDSALVYEIDVFEQLCEQHFLTVTYYINTIEEMIIHFYNQRAAKTVQLIVDKTTENVNFGVMMDNKLN